MSKHTQGSWKVDGITELCIYYVDSRFIGLASINGSNDTYNDSYEGAKANARLMAAAPDLLAALIFAKEMMIANDLDLPNTFEVIDEVIAKARGE